MIGDLISFSDTDPRVLKALIFFSLFNLSRIWHGDMASLSLSRASHYDSQHRLYYVTSSTTLDYNDDKDQ